MVFGIAMGAGQILTLVGASLCFASFLWGALFLFERPRRQPRAMKILSLCIALTIAAQLVAILRFYDHQLLRLVVALAGYAVSFGVFWYAVRAVRGHALAYAFAPSQSREVIQRGPFAWVRHPFYSAYVIAWLAGCVATLQWWLLVPTAITTWLLVRAANSEEAAFLASPMAEAYRAYQSRTGRFLPRLGGTRA